MSISLPKRILTRQRRRQPTRQTEFRPWRPVRRKALLIPSTDPATTAHTAEFTHTGLQRRERRRRRHRLGSGRRSGPRLMFLNIDASWIIVLTALFSAGLAGAGPSNGIQHTDWEFQLFGGPVYIPCVGESVTGTVHVTTRSHSFDTPSGNFHLVESFYGTVSMYSVDSDNTWIGHFALPGTHNVKIKQGESFMQLERENYVPDEGNGRHFFIESAWIFNVNANGELNVVREFPDDFFFDAFRCVGKPN